jgi:hypothetical protein
MLYNVLATNKHQEVTMSYWVYLSGENGAAVEVERHSEGGTFAVGGNDKAELNVTYNYAKCYGLADFSLRDLNGMKGKDAIALLERVATFLGTERYDDYWAPTPGNAGFALSILLGWARQHPDAVFSVS